jgi:hypothetical protein
MKLDDIIKKLEFAQLCSESVELEPKEIEQLLKYIEQLLLKLSDNV